MNYISRAYNYYSGINPATLSGAIDIIVVRSTDENGEDVLACSPFHVRFGKLRVLRAGEKRVTLSLPNNLPEPHIAPFSMKVGDQGEAFFVLETEDEVPLDLMTSPVITAEDDVPPRPSLEEARPPSEAGGDPSASLTLQPFGATEHQVNHAGHNHEPSNSNALPEVEPLDLNATEGSTSSDNALTPTDSSASQGSKLHRDRSHSHNQPPNPLQAQPGEDTRMPIRDYRLSMVHDDGAAEMNLPKVKAGEHEGPAVKYGKDIVLDMGGFHTVANAEGEPIEQHKQETQSQPITPEAGSPVEPKTPKMVQRSDSAPVMPTSPPRPKSPMVVRTAPLESFVEDLMGVPHREDIELPTAMESLSLESGRPAHKMSPAAKLRRGDRMQSEPPEEISRPSSPTGNKADTQMDYAWDWGKIPGGEDEGVPQRRTPHRSESMPTGDESGVHASRASLKPVENDPYQFILELDGRKHLFELSLCGDESFAPNGNASDEELKEFEAGRVTYQKFVEDASIIDDPRLVVYYDGFHLSWTTGYHLLFALAIYRRSTLSKAQSTTDGATRPASGYGWSRWWRRSEAPNTTSAPAPAPEGAPLERAKSQESPIMEKSEAAAPQPVSASQPVSELPTPTGTPGLPPQPVEETHYAKTLRLSSDQLKQLNLKPGPNTVQFSVNSSYSGQAVVSARIFLWEETDQVIISDIDGTITKSDALGHVFAAIGRDWTHVGIANLYTDICNNGYKILYLTARAIGQADTTRDYLKTIVQGDYRMPEGPVIMSPDRLIASLHREVILRKPELFKMACLRDIQRLFASHAKDAFFAGFGNRITDAMSYRSVGIPSGKIYTIDSTGILKTELLASSHRGSYVGLNDLVNEMFPPVKTKVKPDFTDFTYWRDPIPEIDLPDFSPPSPALSARSDMSGNSRLGYLGGLVSLGRGRGSRATSPEPTSQPASPRPSSPLIGPAMSANDLSEDEEDYINNPRGDDPLARRTSMPGSFEDGAAFPSEWLKRGDSRAEFTKKESTDGSDDETQEGDSYADDDAIFDDDILATGEMARVPF